MAINEPPYRIRPITPAAAKAARVKVIPQEVFEVVNELIVRNLKPNGATQMYSRVTQKEITNGILEYKILRDTLIRDFPGIDLERALIDSGWLDFESVYRDSGWTSVSYNRAGYNESYDAYFEFTSNQ